MQAAAALGIFIFSKNRDFTLNSLINPISNVCQFWRLHVSKTSIWDIQIPTTILRLLCILESTSEWKVWEFCNFGDFVTSRGYFRGILVLNFWSKLTTTSRIINWFASKMNKLTTSQGWMNSKIATIAIAYKMKLAFSEERCGYWCKSRLVHSRSNVLECKQLSKVNRVQNIVYITDRVMVIIIIKTFQSSHFQFSLMDKTTAVLVLFMLILP